MTVPLRIVRLCEHIDNSEDLTYMWEEVFHELWSVVGQQHLWRSSLEHRMLGEGYRDVVCHDATMREDLCELYGAVHDDRDEPIAPLSLAERPEDVDGDILERQFGG